ncbi:MAG: hypothetical protein ABIG84_04540 [archaeon]
MASKYNIHMAIAERIKYFLKPTLGKITLTIILYFIISSYLLAKMSPGEGPYLRHILSITVDNVPYLFDMLFGLMTSSSYTIQIKIVSFILLFLLPLMLAYFISCVANGIYNMVGKRNALIILIVGAAIVLSVNILFPRYEDNFYNPTSQEKRLDVLRQYCDTLCASYVDSNFESSKALSYCEKSTEIDINGNDKIHGEAGQLSGFGVCEDRVYCMNIKECRWGASKNSRLTPEKCKDLMCDIYTMRIGDNDTAASYIQQKVQFGNCDVNSFGTNRTLIQWWTNNFKNVHCSGKTG